jgi:hypothetical protein
MNLSVEWIPLLEQAGWSAVHWSAIGEPRAEDRTIMAWALTNGRAVFTHDLDFGTALALTHAGGLLGLYGVSVRSKRGFGVDAATRNRWPLNQHIRRLPRHGRSPFHSCLRLVFVLFGSFCTVRALLWARGTFGPGVGYRCATSSPCVGVLIRPDWGREVGQVRGSISEPVPLCFPNARSRIDCKC